MSIVLKRATLAFVLAACTACAAQAPVTAPPAATANEPVYLSPEQIDSVALLEPPPAEGSDAARGDLQAVLAAQRAAHAAGSTARAAGDAAISCERFADALVVSPAAPNPDAKSALAAGDGAVAMAFATRAALQAAAASWAAKRYWQRPRPYIVSAEVERLGDVAPDNPMPAEAVLERDHTSYPSGHAAFGMACAIVLAQMVPERRAALFARSRVYGESRVIIGAHYPTYVEAGRVIGAAAAAVMLRNSQFQSDLRSSRAALRAALRLSAASP